MFVFLLKIALAFCFASGTEKKSCAESNYRDGEPGKGWRQLGGHKEHRWAVATSLTVSVKADDVRLKLPPYAGGTADNPVI